MRIVFLFWALMAVTLVLYLVIVFWSLPRIANEAGGVTPFDMRPMGYSAEEASTFLTNLSERGRIYYLGTQHLLDWVYPALLGLTFALGFRLRFRGPLLWLLIVLSLCVVAFDWLENLAVAELLMSDPYDFDTEGVARASLWTVLKSGATSVAWIVLIAGGSVSLYRKRTRA